MVRPLYLIITLASLAIGGFALTAEPDPQPVRAAPQPIIAIGVLFEWIEIDHRAANQLLQIIHPTATRRTQLEAMMRAGEAELIETAYLIATPEQPAAIRSVEEVSFPSSGDPPEIPQTFRAHLKEPAGFDHLITPTSPTSVDTEDVGTSVELQVNCDIEGKRLSIDLLAQRVAYLGDGYIGLDPPPSMLHAPMDKPLFHRMRSETEIELRHGEAAIAGIYAVPARPDRRILLLVRANALR